MISVRPNKFSNPDQTVVNAALVMIMHLKKNHIETYEGLKNIAGQKIKGADILFKPALNFLYLLGLIEYLPKTDTFEYIHGERSLFQNVTAR